MKRRESAFTFINAVVCGALFNLYPVLLSASVIDDSAQAASERFQSGLSLLQNGDLQHACDAFRTALVLKPDFVDARYSLGVAMMSGSEPDYLAAMDNFLEVLRLNPRHREAHIQLAVVFEKGGDLDNAVAQLQEAVRLAPEKWESLVLLGQKLQLAKRDAQAIQVFRQALGLNANLDSAHYGIGLALQVLGRAERGGRRMERGPTHQSS